MKLIIDIPDMIYKILNGDSSWGGLSVDYILHAVKDGTPLEAQPTNMRDATEEERKSVKDYVDSVSKPTGVNFNELLRDCGTCKHNTRIDCGQYPCNECNRRTHPLYEPKIIQTTDADCISKEDTLKEFKRVYFDNATVIRCAELILGSMPSVTPQSKTDMLNKIRAEIDRINLNEVAMKYKDRFYGFQREVIKILDKYNTESEDAE